MKTLVFLVLLVIFVQMEAGAVISKTVEDRTQLKPEEEACINELKLDRNQIKSLNSRDITPEDNSEFNDFIGCYWQKMGWQSSDGKINFNSLNVSLQEEVAGSIESENPASISLLKQMVAGAIEECEKTNFIDSNNNGQIAAKVQNCIVKILHELMKEHVWLISHIL